MVGILSGSMIGSQMNFEQEENIFLSSGVLSEVIVNPIAFKIYKSAADEPSSGGQGVTCNLFQKPMPSI